ncbi:MAG: response regulator [Bdellovibrionaceae bacterium]|nr:response regulator [Pseudobdellovibrionaceae bacterium]
MAKILIVDDDKDILKFADALLTQANHEVKIATNPIAAIELLNSRSFDLIITDANMPHYTGFELVKTIRVDARYKNIGIAMLTGLREKESIEKAIKAGVDDYIVKPIDPMIFLRKVKELLDKKPPRKQQELNFSSIAKETNAKITLETQVISVSESSMKLRTQFALPEDSLLNIQTQIFNSMGIEPPPLKVISVLKVDSEFHLTIGYVGLTEQDSEKIRNWINNELNKRKYKAI